MHEVPFTATAMKKEGKETWDRFLAEWLNTLTKFPVPGGAYIKHYIRNKCNNKASEADVVILETMLHNIGLWEGDIIDADELYIELEFLAHHA